MQTEWESTSLTGKSPGVAGLRYGNWVWMFVGVGFWLLVGVARGEAYLSGGIGIDLADRKKIPGFQQRFFDN